MISKKHSNQIKRAIGKRKFGTWFLEYFRDQGILRPNGTEYHLQDIYNVMNQARENETLESHILDGFEHYIQQKEAEKLRIEELTQKSKKLSL